MQIIGADFGNSNMATSEKVIFPSKLCRDERIINMRKETDENLLIYEGNKILVGEGEFEIQTNKLYKSMFKPCLLKSLALSCNQDIVNIVLGIPAVQYNSKNKDMLKNELLSDKVYNFSLAGKERTLILEKVEVFPESVGSYYALTKEEHDQFNGFDLILVNLGGGNTNVAYFKLEGTKRKLVRSSTIMGGILNLYRDLIAAVNGEYSLSKDIEDAESILKKGLYVYGEKQDLSFTKPIILEHTDRIFKELNSYPIETSKVMFTGGASVMYRPILKQRLPGCLFQSNFLMSNAEGFKKVGEALWLKEYQ